MTTDILLTIAILAIFVIFVVAFVLIIKKVAKKQRKDREDSLYRYARLNNFSFDPEVRVREAFEKFLLFQKRDWQKFSNELSKREFDRSVSIFDFSYTTGTNNDRKTYRQNVYMARSEQWSFPEFSLEPQNFFDNILKVFGYQDIDFDSNSTFSKMYLLRGSNEEHIRSLFKPRILKFFESVKGVSVEGNKDTIIIYVKDRLFSSDELDTFIRDCKKVLDELDNK